jgi:hypothetical protein
MVRVDGCRQGVRTAEVHVNERSSMSQPPPLPGNPWHMQETYKSLITISVECMKMLAVVNGGAAIAILTYLGNLLARASSPQPVPHIGWALVWYCGGLFGAVLAFILSYLVQLQLYQEDVAQSSGTAQGRLKHQWLLWIAICVVFLSAISFAVGCLQAASALGVW